MWYMDARLKPAEWKGQAVRYRHEKKDGHGLRIFRRENGRLGACFREPENDCALELRDFSFMNLTEKQLPRVSMVAGEVYLPGHKASAVPTAIKEKDQRLRFAVFAAPWWRGVRWFRRDPLWVQELMRELGYEVPEMQPFSVDVRDTSWGVHAENLRALAKSRGFEGYVLKQYSYSEWYKVKVYKSVDVVLTDLKPSESTDKYAGCVGALVGSVLDKRGDLVEITSCAGMPDEIRFAVRQSDVGRVFEVEYQEVASRGRLRHPRFLRWRPDKPARECLWTQLEV